MRPRHQAFGCRPPSLSVPSPPRYRPAAPQRPLAVLLQLRSHLPACQTRRQTRRPTLTEWPQSMHDPSVQRRAARCLFRQVHPQARCQAGLGAAALPRALPAAALRPGGRAATRRPAAARHSSPSGLRGPHVPHPGGRAPPPTRDWPPPRAAPPPASVPYADTSLSSQRDFLSTLSRWPSLLTSRAGRSDGRVTRGSSASHMTTRHEAGR